MVAYVLCGESYSVKSNGVNVFSWFHCFYIPPLFFVQGAVIATNFAENLQSEVFSVRTRGPTLSASASTRPWQQVLREKAVPEALPGQETNS